MNRFYIWEIKDEFCGNYLGAVGKTPKQFTIHVEDRPSYSTFEICSEFRSYIKIGDET
jgi:hypothetical protein